MENNRHRRIRIDAPASTLRPSRLRESDAYLRLQRLADAPTFNRDTIVEFVREYPGIAERLLRVVNSAQYGLRAPVSDLHHAIGLLGPSGLLKFTGPFATSNTSSLHERNSSVR